MILPGQAFRDRCGGRPAAIRSSLGQLQADQPRLELWAGGNLLKQLDLLNQRYRIGRDPDCDLPLAEPSLSRVHAILEKQHQGDR